LDVVFWRRMGCYKGLGKDTTITDSQLNRIGMEALPVCQWQAHPRGRHVAQRAIRYFPTWWGWPYRKNATEVSLQPYNTSITPSCNKCKYQKLTFCKMSFIFAECITVFLLQVPARLKYKAEMVKIHMLATRRHAIAERQ
jgi:hypothetical protein